MAEKILVVDDDLDTLKLVGMMLQRQGYNIVAAMNGAQALAKVTAERPDLLLLDVMMPDIDGFEVCRRVRADPAFATVPILMFTAKAQVDDKVQGFEAGADDYLPKPTHPAELLAHVKALLGRSRVSSAGSAAMPSKRARLICFIGAKGGLGTTTVALNVAISMAMRKQDVIFFELRPGQGIAGSMLGVARTTGLNTLLQKGIEELTPQNVEKELIAHPSGLRALLASSEPHDFAQINQTAKWDAILHSLTALSGNLICDLGNSLLESIAKVAVSAEQVIILVEPMRSTVSMAKALWTDLESIGIVRTRIDFILVNRERSSLQMARAKIEEMLGQQAIGMITPAPELVYQAAESGVPMVARDPNALVSDQLRQVTDRVMAKSR